MMRKYIDYENYLEFKKGLEDLYNHWIETKPCQIKMHRDVVNYFENYEMPLIVLEPNYYFDSLYPFFMFAKSKDLGVCDVNTELIGGHNCSGVRKKIPSNTSRVWGAIVYILGLAEEEFKPIQLYKINQDYYISDGKHRFYAHLLLGKNTIRAQVIEYNYSDFLQNAYIEEYFGDNYLYYNDELKGMNIEDDEKKELVFRGVKCKKLDDNLLDESESFEDFKKVSKSTLVNFLKKLIKN